MRLCKSSTKMKKIFFYLSLFTSMTLPLAVSADMFPRDLYVGMVNNSDVKSLQEFLRAQGLYDGPATGNFFSLTKQAVIKFQEKEGIIPSQGYFGPKTRSRISAYSDFRGIYTRIATPSREKQIALLESQIKILRDQLVNLIAQQQAVLSPVPSIPTPAPTPIATPTLLSSPSPSPTSLPPVATTTPIIPVAELRITGSSTQPFPSVAVSPLKLGDITISNTTDRAILFNQFELDLYDAMNSTANRDKTVLFKLRDGTTTFGDVISQTNFDINREPPPVGEERRRQLKVSFPRLIQPGQTYTSSLWVENLDYVTSGSWRIQLLTAFINDAITPQGGFTFVLTR